MNWRRLKKSWRGEPDVTCRSEEVADIIERMPEKFGRWVSLSVVFFSMMLLLFGWLIKYPDVVSGTIEITSNVSPVKLVANTSGKLLLSGYGQQDLVTEGACIGEIENPARTEDVALISGLLRQMVPDAIPRIEIHRLFPEKVTLGDLNLKYYSFLTALKTYCEYRESNVYEQQQQTLTDEIQGKRRLKEETEQVLRTAEEYLSLSEKWYDRYCSMNEEVVSTYEYEVDRNRMEYLSHKQSEQNLRKELVSVQIQITDSENRLLQTGIEKKDKERQLQLELLSSYHDLTDNIKQWEDRYLFKAPFAGKVEYLSFWVDNQYISAGTEVFSIVPGANKPVGQMLLPASGAGKVKVGQKVAVKLTNYPYTEFGYIDGKVQSISLVTQPYDTGTKMIDAYLVLVEMYRGLTTNYGEELDFQYTTGGTADIIVKDRRLIARLFDNLKSRTK